MLREARIICPKADNDGNPLDLVHKRFLSALVKSFGGVTVTDGKGAWVGPNGLQVEDNVIYDIACNAECPLTDYELEQHAANLCIDARQFCIYLRYPDGDVEFVEAKHHASIKNIAHQEAA